MTGTGEANAAHAEFWNSAQGTLWVNNQGRLDAAMAPMLAQMTEHAAPQPGEQVLDVGCGTGASSLHFGTCVGASGHVTGADISSVLLGHAQSRVEAAGAANVGLLLCDAQTHPFAPQAFDLVVSRFGMMFFEGPVAAFANIARAMRRGGRMVFVAWAPMEENPWFTVPRDAAVRRLGAPPPLDPNAPGAFAFGNRDRVAGLMREAGLAEVRAERLASVMTPPGAVEAVAEFASSAGPAARIMQQRGGSPADERAIVAEVRKAFAAYAAPEGLRVPAMLNLFSARVG